MAIFQSDGKKLIGVEYDETPQLNDTVDGRLVISKDIRGDEYALFLLEPNGRICCYVLDEIYIIGKADGFATLVEAAEAWNNSEI